jgi:NAD(P)-dependent dehydrogenase (short-subunit alcohol dehydrogenase family)
MRLEGKVALITEGNEGVGLAIAKAYAREGAMARDAEANKQAVGQIPSQGGRAYSISCDLRDFHSLPGVVAQAVELAAHGDILVNNAGIVDLRPLQEVTPENWDAIFDTNVKGLFFMLQAAAVQMIKQDKGGKIINVSSQAARRGEGLVLVYGASKAAVIHMKQTAALDNVNGIAPGVIDTPMWDIVDAQFCKYKGLPLGSARKMAEAGVPHGRFGVPDDLAGAAVFLASKDAEYIVAQTLNVDGGNWMS